MSAADLRAQMEQMDRLVKSCGSPYSREELVLTHGKEFTPFLRPDWMTKHPDKECFSNSVHLVYADTRLTYVEGFALMEYGIALNHAWVMLPDGTMIDPTWKTQGIAYIGIPFKWEYVLKVMAQSGYYGILDNHRWRDIFTDPPEIYVKGL